jgi:hypothetical protein
MLAYNFLIKEIAVVLYDLPEIIYFPFRWSNGWVIFQLFYC